MPMWPRNLVQDALLSAWRNRAQYEQRSSERTWLIGILKHKWFDYLRHRVRQQAAQETPRDQALAAWVETQFSRFGKWRRMPDPWPATESWIESAELGAALRQCLDRLPTASADALLLVECDDQPITAVAELLGFSVGNVAVRLHRARLAMRYCLERRWFNNKEDSSS